MTPSIPFLSVSRRPPGLPRPTAFAEAPIHRLPPRRIATSVRLSRLLLKLPATPTLVRLLILFPNARSATDSASSSNHH